MILDPILLLTAYQQSCSYGGVDPYDWIRVNALMVVVIFMIGALVYALSNLFPVSMREKLKGGAKVEMVQGVISLVIVIVLIGAAFSACDVGGALVQHSTAYNDPIQMSEAYIYNLMFTQGLSLFSQIYAESIALVFWGNIIEEVVAQVENLITLANFSIGIGGGVIGTFFGFSSAMTATFSALIAVTFGILYILWLLLPIIEALAFPVIVPLALVMRSIPFAGPRLRESADSLLAIAIAFYLIFPLTILLDNFIITWLYTACPGGAAPGYTGLCNPYSQYITTGYQLNNQPVLTIFQSNPFQIGTFNLPGDFWGVFFTGNGGGNGLMQAIQVLWDLPGVIMSYGELTAQYLFQGIVLIALDMAITIGFAQGLSKGLGSISRMMGAGPVW